MHHHNMLYIEGILPLNIGYLWIEIVAFKAVFEHTREYRYSE